MTGTDLLSTPLSSKPFDSLPPAFQKRIRELEDELDRIHPGWRDTRREARRFDDKPIEQIYRIKWVLKRRDLLLRGHDWAVLMTKSANGKMWFSHPMNPADIRALNEIPVVQDEAIEARIHRTRAALLLAGTMSTDEVEAVVLDLEARLKREAAEAVDADSVRLNPRNDVPRDGVQ